MSERLTANPSIEQLKALAHSLPKAAHDDGRPLEPFRGTFHTKFPIMKAVARGYGQKEEVTYVRMTKERFGMDLEAFYWLYPELCDSICSLLDEKSSYDALTEAYDSIVSEELAGKIIPGTGQAIIDATGHSRGLEAIGLYYWDKINPLLEQAYIIFDNEGLNAPFLGR